MTEGGKEETERGVLDFVTLTQASLSGRREP